MLIILFLFNRYYGSNDNIAILWNIKADCLVYFMSVSLGKFLSFCYLNITDKIPWYGLTLYTFLGVSLYCTIFSIWKFQRLGNLLIPFLTMFLALSLRHVIHIDYSAVSILLASGSLLGLLVYLEKADKKCLLPVIILGICFSFSYHIRMDGIKAALCFTAPAVLLGVFEIRKSYIYLLVFIIPLAITISADRLYRNFIETETDIRFREWNTLRGQFHDFPIQYLNQNNELIRDANHWSQNDYLMLSEWIYLDENKFNVDTLRNIFKYALPLPAASIKVLLPLMAYKFIELVKTYPVYSCVLIFLALIGLIIRGKYNGIIQVFYLCYIFGGTIWMLIFFRLPPRIGSPTLLICVIWMTYMVFCLKTIRFKLNHRICRPKAQNVKPQTAAFAWLQKNTDNSRPVISIFSVMFYMRIKNKLMIFAGLLFLFFSSVSMCNYYNNIKVIYRAQKEYDKNIKDLEATNASLFLIQPRKFSLYQYADPLKYCNFSFKVIPCGWPIFSPFFYEVLRKNGMEHAYEIFPRIIGDKDCYIVGDNETVTLMSIYLWETYGLRNSIISARQLNDHLFVYRIEAQ
jgi:hypothetical protein